MKEKTLDITEIKGAKANISDIKIFGDGDTFRLICKASSQEQGWMKSTKAMAIPGVGCVIQVTTQQRNPDGSYSLAEALTFVPNVELIEEDGIRLITADVHMIASREDNSVEITQDHQEAPFRVFVVNNPNEQ